MRCPWCGSGPVMIRGDWWECGWCGDSGRLKRSAEPEKIEMTLSFSIVYHVDLPETWGNMKSALEILAPGRDDILLPLLGKVLLHEISAGIQHHSLPSEHKKLQELEHFLKETLDLRLDAPASFIVQTIQSYLLYQQEAELSEQSCGKFWKELISYLTSDQYHNGEPDGLFDLLHELSSAYSYFGAISGEELATAQERRFVLNDAFYLHWQENVLLHPDVARAKQLLAQGEFLDNEDICRDILVTEFPEEMTNYTLEELDDHCWDDILDDVFERDASKAIRMWRTLLDTASSRLYADPETAKRLLYDWSVLDFPSSQVAESFLTALEDETFVEQMFQSADVGNLQRDLLTVCRNFNRIELGQHCLELVLKNPYLNGAWEQRLKKALTPYIRPPKPQGPSQSIHIPSVGDIPDDGTVFHYCTVRIQGVRRVYSYLTGDLPLKVGDWVEVPFGKENQPRRGQVGSITDCTRLVAPWPPEQTKPVLRIVESLPAPEGKIDRTTAVVSTIASEANFTSVQKPEVTLKSDNASGKETISDPEVVLESGFVLEENPIPVSAIFSSTSESIQEKPSPALEEAVQDKSGIEVSLPDIDTVAPQKRKLPWKFVFAGLAMFIAVAGGAFAYHGWNLHYRQAEQSILDDNLSEATKELEEVPSFFRSQKQLVRYMELCELAQSGTEKNYKTALDGIQNILSNSNETLRSTIQAKYDIIAQQYHDQLYQTALSHLQEKQFDQAQEYLRQVSKSPYANELLCYAQAGSRVPLSKTSAQLSSIMGLLDQIPADYVGPFAEEIPVLRSEVANLITEATAREKAEEAERARRAEEARKAEEARIAALKATGLPYVGMPETDIHTTRQLGKAGYSGTSSDYKQDAAGKYYRDTWNVYAWYDTSGNIVFEAECRSGKVFQINRYGDSAWNGDKLQVKLGPFRPQTFNSGIADDEYSGDTGPGSGHSLRDDYGSPEDLYEEDGTYSDLDEAIDEWEEGW